MSNFRRGCLDGTLVIPATDAAVSRPEPRGALREYDEYADLRWHRGRRDQPPCVQSYARYGGGLALAHPRPAAEKTTGDPFITMSARGAKAWMALFAHAQRNGTWRPRPVDPSRPELTDGQQLTLTAHWTVAGLAYAMGVNRDTAGKALQELVGGGWVRREDPRNKGQYGGIDYYLTSPAAVTCADKLKVAKDLKARSGIQGLSIPNRRPCPKRARDRTGSAGYSVADRDGPSRPGRGRKKGD